MNGHTLIPITQGEIEGRLTARAREIERRRRRREDQPRTTGKRYIEYFVAAQPSEGE